MPESVALTTSQVNKLGEKLRAADGLPEDLLRSLQELRAEYHAPMLKAQALVRDRLGVEATARLKTVNTIVEKLKREKTRLSRMQDIAGLRIIVGPWRGEQDDLVRQLKALFGADTEIDDRRARPSHSYRAVHVMPRVDGYLVEIQVRTQLQDLWAQVFERLADHLGRGIRYGAQPEAGHDLVKHLREIAELVARIEENREKGRTLTVTASKILADKQLSAEERREFRAMRVDVERSLAEEYPEFAKTLAQHLHIILKQIKAVGLA